jgi:hypothetical protein
MSRSRQKGTWWETTVVRWLLDLGFSRAERKAHGPDGDITGVFEWAIEAKNAKRITLAEYIDQLDEEMRHSGANYGAVVIHRRGKGGVDDAYVVMPGRVWARVLRNLET